MKGLITKPQFDTNLFKVGKAIFIIKMNSSFCKDCLIKESTPLLLKLVYMDTDGNGENGEETMLTIYIEDIIEKNYKFSFFTIDRKEE